MPALYDTIGTAYSVGRRTDPRIARAVWDALGTAASVVNVGAGTGSYEPADRPVVAIDPSLVMLAQRAATTAPAVCAHAEVLPFDDDAFAATLAVLTVHHWSDQLGGLRECARVARERVVVLTWDPASASFWLVQQYFPDLLALDRSIFPAIEAITALFPSAHVRVVPIPADCQDGFLGAYWQRPAAYLDPAVRSGMSSFGRVGTFEPGLVRLRDDLASGAWRARHGGLLTLEELDLGYRLVVGELQ